MSQNHSSKKQEERVLIVTGQGLPLGACDGIERTTSAHGSLVALGNYGGGMPECAVCA